MAEVVTDTRLRELERRWRETRAEQDEAAYLAERLRVGAVSRESVELDAFCGSRVARSVVGGASVGRPALLSEDGHAALAWAIDQARSAGSPCLDLHVLAGVLVGRGATTWSVLADLGVSEASIAWLGGRVRELMQDEVRPTVLPADRTLELVRAAVSERDSLGDASVGSEHLLLAILLHGGLAAQLLEELGLRYWDTREALRELSLP